MEKRGREESVVDTGEDEPEKKYVPSSSSSSSKKHLLVVLPGGFKGKISDSMKKILEHEDIKERFDVRLPGGPNEKLSWNKRDPGSKKNIEQVNEMCKQDDEDNPVPLFVIGNSFGNRVAAEMLANESFSPIAPTKVMFAGYPLKHKEDKEDNNQSRMNSLTNLPKNANIVFVSGDTDEYLNRDYLDDDHKGEACLMEAVDMLLCRDSCEVIILPNAKHDLPNATGGKKSREQTVNKLRWIILDKLKEHN